VPDAIVFDFDGVVVDSEPIHLAGFQRVLATVGVEMTREAYYAEYLGFDDRGCIEAAARDQGVQLAAHRVAQLIAAKTKMVKRLLSDCIDALPGAAELIRAASEAGVPLAICSGALRDEIELASRAVGVWDCFDVVVAAEDVKQGKPDPAAFRLAAERLADKLGREIAPERCVAMEDSPAGIDAARAAGMKALAVTNSYSAADLAVAEGVVDSLVGVTLEELDRLIGAGQAGENTDAHGHGRTPTGRSS